MAITQLPDECLWRIFSLVNPLQVLRAARTSRRFNAVAKDDLLWKLFYQQVWSQETQAYTDVTTPFRDRFKQRVLSISSRAASVFDNNPQEVNVAFCSFDSRLQGRGLLLARAGVLARAEVGACDYASSPDR
jgi:hypothetical protein